MQCCEQAKWKREEIADHKFDYIDVNDFVEDTWTRKFSYSLVFLVTLKSLVMCITDIVLVSLVIYSLRNGLEPGCPSDNQTDVTNNANTGVSSSQLTSTFSPCKAKDGTEFILPGVARPFIFIASVVFSFILLLLDWRKSQTIIESRDISYAFTSPIAYRYYSLRSYPHYCFFSQIQNSRKTVDVLAFFVFFQFKGWKRLLLAEFPRQFIIALGLHKALTPLDLSQVPKDFIASGYPSKRVDFITDAVEMAKFLYRRAGNNGEVASFMTMCLSLLSCSIFTFSIIGLVAAFFIYLPLLCNIRGNLKEFCCHKIDKRIGELLRKKSRKRQEQARRAELAEIERNNILKRRAAAEKGDSDTGSDNGEYYNKAAPPIGMTQRPTLPDIDVDLDAPVSRFNDTASITGSDNGVSTAGYSGMYPPGSSAAGQPRPMMAPLPLPPPGGFMPPPPGGMMAPPPWAMRGGVPPPGGGPPLGIPPPRMMGPPPPMGMPPAPNAGLAGSRPMQPYQGDPRYREARRSQSPTNSYVGGYGGDGSNAAGGGGGGDYGRRDYQPQQQQRIYAPSEADSEIHSGDPLLNGGGGQAVRGTSSEWQERRWDGRY